MKSKLRKLVLARMAQADTQTPVRRQWPAPRRKQQVMLTNAEWEERFQKFIDPTYYDRDPRSLLGSTLRGTNYSIAAANRRMTRGRA